MTSATSESVRARRHGVADTPLATLLSQCVSLTNGSYGVQLRGDGSGYSAVPNAAVTRAPSDPNADPDGFYLFLTDLDSKVVWSAGYRPTRATPAFYDFRSGAKLAEIVRVDHGIECHLLVCVSPRDDFEVRLCRLRNLGAQRRHLEITSYLEWVLGSPAADAGHPAFSKLFVETSYCPDRNAILAQRRPRHSEECPLWGFHSVVLNAASRSRAGVAFETNRARFIGRGRVLDRPRAMEIGERLTGDFGSVLDPVAALRLAVELEPGEIQESAFVLGAAPIRNEIDRMLESVVDFSAIRKLTDDAATAELDAKQLTALSRPLMTGSNGERIQVHPPHRTGPQNGADSATKQDFTQDASTRVNGEIPRANSPVSLEFDNSYGGFAYNGREYVIRVPSDGRGGQRRPPMPWVNVIANEQAGFLVTESGAGYTWCGNSRLNRLTTWHNDPVSDPHSEALWIRDEEAGVYWSPLPGPTPSANDYRVRHGLGYTTFEHENLELSQETTVFMARESPLKITRCRITNRSGKMRRLSLFYYLRWALGGLAAETAGQVLASCDANDRIIWAVNPNRQHYGGCSAFSTVCLEPPAAVQEVSSTCHGAAFFGRDGAMRSPLAVVHGGKLDPTAGDPDQPCAAWQVSIELQPGATFEGSFLLGEAASREEASRIIRAYGGSDQLQRAYECVTEFWNELTSAIVVETPNREIDLMVNGWLLYQNLSCRMWGRSAYYQPGGAFGFRDQLQDSAAFVHHRPDITRTQILRHAAQQFVEGDVLHWWHPDTGYGVRTRFSDDLLWLPCIAAEYVHKTGDQALLDEEVPFITSEMLADGQQEAYLRPGDSGESASLYEHCCRALDRGLTTGANGLPLIGCGDWNDGFSRVGQAGRGESVWLGFFIDHVLQQMLPLCARRGDDDRLHRYSAYRERLRSALNSAGWDGAWYRRAYYDNGQPLGSATSDECQIDAIAQSWSVLSGAAPPERARMAMDAVESRLVDNEAGMIRLLTPSFNSTPNDPGYIKGYLPGIRENGGQYTHGVLWVIRALAELGRGTRAVDLLRMLSPVWHTTTPEKVGTYATEPYVVAADIYGEPPHVGRGGWTWYTGSAGWMYRVAIESIFGLTTEQGQTLVINPSISSAWPRCRLSYRLPGGPTRYDITIENPSGNEHGVIEAFVDGQPTVVENGAARVVMLRDGKSHQVIVRL